MRVATGVKAGPIIWEMLLFPFGKWPTFIGSLWTLSVRAWGAAGT